MAPVDHGANAKPINFQVAFPKTWNGRAVQMGGGGMNGAIPMLAGPPLAQGYVTYGSDSGHQAIFGRGPARGDAAASDDWALNEEAIRNLGYMQLRKTHDAAMVLIERLYGSKSQFNYFVGSSQGGREALTVAERYPNDYDGIAANVPIVGFSSLMLAPALIRIHEKPQANWITAARVNAIRGEFMRQRDKLDGLVDGIINNYMACRETFDVKQGKPNRHPWAAKRCPDNMDPNPADTTADACLTDRQISTLEFVYSRYSFSQPLANNVKSFGMWLPNTDPSGSGLIANTRFRGQEGAAGNVPPDPTASPNRSPHRANSSARPPLCPMQPPARGRGSLLLWRRRIAMILIRNGRRGYSSPDGRPDHRGHRTVSGRLRPRL
jgi:Tannase and feruloyl esterase